MTVTETKSNRVDTPSGDRSLVRMTVGDVTEFGGSGVIPIGTRRAGRQRRRPIRTGHRLPPPEAALRTYR